MSARNEERAFLIECIELYKTLPALWNVKANEYKNRQEKSNAYKLLLSKYNERYPTATREDLIKKINSLRTNYRKELRRIKDSKKSGAGSDEVVEPTLWYFDQMSFLGDQNNVMSSISTTEPLKEEEESPYDITQTSSEAHNAATFNPFAKKKKKKTSQEELLNLECDRLRTGESEYDKIAKAWAVELSKMSSEQQIHAKKAINDILYEGQLGNLYRNCVQIHPPPSFSPVISTLTSFSSSTSKSPQEN